MECKTFGQRHDILCCCLCPDRAQAQVPNKWDLPNQGWRVEGASTVCECYAWPASWREEGAHYRERCSGHISAWGPMVRTQCTRVTACGRVAGSDTPTILGFASLCSLEQFLHGHHSNVQLAIACSGPGVGWLGELIQNLGYIQDAWISSADDK